jgi:lysozyme family protein
MSDKSYYFNTSNRRKSMYPQSYENAVNHIMLYEIGRFWKLTDDVRAGLINTPVQKKAVGYVNDPLDSGGETKFGISKNGNPDLNITNLTWADAEAVYFDCYWVAGVCDRLPSRVAILHFDSCVNHGIGRAKKFLQKAVGAEPDGIVGKQTLIAIASLNPVSICHKICDQREQFYRDIVNAKPDQQRFLNGWLRRISEMREFVTDSSNVFE